MTITHFRSVTHPTDPGRLPASVELQSYQPGAGDFPPNGSVHALAAIAPLAGVVGALKMKPLSLGGSSAPAVVKVGVGELGPAGQAAEGQRTLQMPVWAVSVERRFDQKDRVLAGSERLATKQNESGRPLMALKDLLVFVDKTADALQRLTMAADLASRHGSRLTALYVHEWNEAQLHAHRTAEMSRLSGAELANLDQLTEAALEQQAEEKRSLLEDIGRERGLATEWRVVEGPASLTVTQHARYADLCILGHHRSLDQDPNSYTFSEKLLFSSGRPCLFIPPGQAATTLGRHIVVAWNSSRAAARSINDALPLIERAERTTIVTVNAEDFIARNGGLPARQLVEHLARHGAAPELIQLEHVATGSIGDTLQAKAQELGGDLMVTGAFGHPRLWERLLGGATRDLLDRMSLPIMMSS